MKLLQLNILYLLFSGRVQAQWYRCDRPLQTAAEVHLCCAAVPCLHWCGGEYGGQIPRTRQKPDRSVFCQEHCRGRNRESPFCLGSLDVSLRTWVTDCDCDTSFVAGGAVEGLAPPERGHHQGQTQAADGGLRHDATTLRTCWETTQPPAAGEHDILWKHVTRWRYS